MSSDFSNLTTLTFLRLLDESAPYHIKVSVFSNSIKLCNRLAYVKYINGEDKHLEHLEFFIIENSMLYAHYRQETILNYIEAYIKDYLSIYNLQANSSSYITSLSMSIRLASDLIGELPLKQQREDF